MAFKIHWQHKHSDKKGVTAAVYTRRDAAYRDKKELEQYNQDYVYTVKFVFAEKNNKERHQLRKRMERYGN